MSHSLRSEEVRAGR